MLSSFPSLEYDDVISMDLPEECWELILSSLGDERHFEPISLVSRKLLSITNNLRRNLVFTQQALHKTFNLLPRFPNLKKLDFSQVALDVDAFLCSVSECEMDLVSLNISNQKEFPITGLRELVSKNKNLRELICSKIGLKDEDVIAIAESCPAIEVLDISYPDYNGDDFPDGSPDLRFCSGFVTDAGIHAMAVKLERLLKIDVSGNFFLTDKSLASISSKCPLLKELVVNDCDFITQTGIGLLMGSSQHLSSISMNGIGIPSIHQNFTDKFGEARNLCEVDLSNSFLSDEFLCSIAEASLKLKKVSLSHCRYYTFAGISVLLQKYQSLENLNLEAADFLSDESMIELSKFLQSLTSIKLCYCSMLTNATFFTLIRDCPLLSEIKMEYTNLGIEEFPMDSKINPRVKSLYLARNGNLSSEFLKKVALLCPSLQVLDVTSCLGISEEGIGEILRNCSQVRHLEINVCRQLNNLGIGFDLPKLEVLRASGSGLNEDALIMIANHCCRLLYLNLEKCFNVTTSGLVKVVENCISLREINLKWCNVNDGIVAWMVFTRPSLRKIIPPGGFAPSNNQRSYFFNHGCLVCDG